MLNGKNQSTSPPHPIEEELNEYLKEKNLSQKCVCFSAEKLGDESNLDLAYKIFNLEKIEMTYFEILNSLNVLEKTIKHKKSKKKESLKTFQTIIDKFEETLLNDPFLPKELLPKDWPVVKIKKKIKKLFAIIG